VAVLHTMDRFENTALTSVTTPLRRHPWSAEICRRRFSACVVYKSQRA